MQRKIEKVGEDKLRALEAYGEIGVQNLLARTGAASGTKINEMRVGKDKEWVVRWEAEAFLEDLRQRRERRATVRFHLIFWPTIVSVLTGFVLLYFAAVGRG